MLVDNGRTRAGGKIMKETWNVLDPDEYVKHNPFMGYTNMKIEKISPECSEISMKITHGVTARSPWRSIRMGSTSWA